MAVGAGASGGLWRSLKSRARTTKSVAPDRTEFPQQVSEVRSLWSLEQCR